MDGFYQQITNDPQKAKSQRTEKGKKRARVSNTVIGIAKESR